MKMRLLLICASLTIALQAKDVFIAGRDVTPFGGDTEAVTPSETNADSSQGKQKKKNSAKYRPEQPQMEERSDTGPSLLSPNEGRDVTPWTE